MKYYAVTEDPMELMHYGVKGMKWGQHIFGDKQQRSAGYKKAVSKLKASMKNGIKKSQSKWAEASDRAQAKRSAKQQKLYEHAQQRLAEVMDKQANKAIRKEQNAIRREQNAVKREIRKENSAERREQRQMNRYMQKARHGTLKYKKLRDDQIVDITNRLSLENQARRVSGNETPLFLTRVKRAVGEGVVQGISRGTSAYIEERVRGKAQYDVKRKYAKKQAAEEASAQHIRDRRKRKDDLKYDRQKREADLEYDREKKQYDLKTEQKQARDKARLEVDKEYYKELAETGGKRAFLDIFGTASSVRRSRGSNLKTLKDSRKNEQESKDSFKKFIEAQQAEAKRREQEEDNYDRRLREYYAKKQTNLYFDSLTPKQTSIKTYKIKNSKGKRKKTP